jgi:hypothetical protein
LYKLRLEYTFEVHQNYIRFILKVDGRDRRLFYVFLIRHFKTEQEKAGPFFRSGKTVFGFWNKG